jgi:hypothetical protein
MNKIFEKESSLNDIFEKEYLNKIYKNESIDNFYEELINIEEKKEMKEKDLISKEGHIIFEIGNPEVETIQGIIHLFKNSNKKFINKYEEKLPVFKI